MSHDLENVLSFYAGIGVSALFAFGLYRLRRWARRNPDYPDAIEYREFVWNADNPITIVPVADPFQPELRS